MQVEYKTDDDYDNRIHSLASSTRDELDENRRLCLAIKEHVGHYFQEWLSDDTVSLDDYVKSCDILTLYTDYNENDKMFTKLRKLCFDDEIWPVLNEPRFWQFLEVYSNVNWDEICEDIPNFIFVINRVINL